MKTYIVRNEQGVMVATLSAEIVAVLALTANGAWRAYQEKDKPETRAFVLAQDMAAGDLARLGVRLYLWAGYKVIESVA